MLKHIKYLNELIMALEEIKKGLENRKPLYGELLQNVTEDLTALKEARNRAVGILIAFLIMSTSLALLLFNYSLNSLMLDILALSLSILGYMTIIPFVTLIKKLLLTPMLALTFLKLLFII